MSTFFLDLWTFAFSQIGLVAIGILLREWLAARSAAVADDEAIE